MKQKTKIALIILQALRVNSSTLLYIVTTSSNHGLCSKGRLMSIKVIFLIVLIAQKYSGKVDLRVAFRQYAERT